jgi:hypothetical protein
MHWLHEAAGSLLLCQLRTLPMGPCSPVKHACNDQTAAYPQVFGAAGHFPIIMLHLYLLAHASHPPPLPLTFPMPQVCCRPHNSQAEAPKGGRVPNAVLRVAQRKELPAAPQSDRPQNPQKA